MISLPAARLAICVSFRVEYHRESNQVASQNLCDIVLLAYASDMGVESVRLDQCRLAHQAGPSGKLLMNGEKAEHLQTLTCAKYKFCTFSPPYL